MQKNLFSIFTFFLFCSSAIVFGQELIQPFGNLEWKDGLPNVITKLSNMQNVEEVYLHREDGKPIDVKGIGDTQLKVAIRKAIETKYGLYIKKGSFPFDVWPFLNKLGEECKCPLTWEKIIGSIVATPIIIKNSPFTLVAEFELAPGMAVMHPQQVITETKFGFSFPLVLTRVLVVSCSPSLKDNIKDLSKLLEKKYSKYAPDKGVLGYTGEALTGEVWDDKGTRIILQNNWGGNCDCYQISYQSQAYIKVLEEIYRKHISNIEQNKLNKMKDQSPDL